MVTVDKDRVREFATRYTAAWCSRNAASVASHFAGNGSLKINGSDPAIGRAAIAGAAQGFMTTFPDLVVKMDGLIVESRGHFDEAKYQRQLRHGVASVR